METFGWERFKRN